MTQHPLKSHTAPMVEARLELTAEYYQLFWRDFLRTRARFRKWSVPLGLALMIGGTVVMGVADRSSGRGVAGLLLAALGGFELAWHYWDRARWLRTMTAGSHLGGEVVLQFDQDTILHTGPTARGEMTWEAIERLVRGTDGLFLVLERGLSMYVPLSAFEDSEDVAAVERMFEASRS